MLDVLIALMPAAVASVIIFGISSLFVILACVISAVAAEFVFNVICRKEQTIGDLSSAVTGLLLALNIPSTIPPVAGFHRRYLRDNRRKMPVRRYRSELR